jgi:alpha-tubulin suppressor-like RCC1 family protein
LIVAVLPTAGFAASVEKSQFASIAVGDYGLQGIGPHTLAVKSDGSLWAWGENESGQLGDGTTIDRLTPIKIMDGVASVTAYSGHSMAIKTIQPQRLTDPRASGSHASSFG